MLRFLSLILLLPLSGAERPKDFDVSLDVTNGRTSQTRPATKATARATISGSVSDGFTIRWKITHRKKDTAENILVHFFVVRLERKGEAPPPLDPKKVVIEGALTMDFAADDTATGDQKFRVREPGVYLTRVEVRPESDAPGRETFSELELVVK